MRFLLTQCLLIFGLLISQTNAQYAHVTRDKNGDVYSINFGGEAKWLLAQETDEARWHLFPELVCLTLNYHYAPAEEIIYISKLTKLTSLDLGMAPEGLVVEPGALTHLSKLKNLEFLWLNKHHLCNEDLKFVRHLKKLEELEITPISHVFNDQLCALNTFYPDHIRKKLKPHAAYYLDDDVADDLAQAISLETLLIHGKFTDKFIRKLAKLPKLGTLHITSEKLTDRSLATIGQNYRLKHLTLESDQITNAGVEALCTPTNPLETFWFTSPQLSREMIPYLANLKQLKRIDLPFKVVKKEDFAAIAKMKNLKILVLSEAKFGDAEFALLKGHPSLERISLESAKLTKKSIEIIKSMKKLRHLDSLIMRIDEDDAE